MSRALLDGDVICYRAAVVQQETYKWSSDTSTTTLTGSAKDAADYALNLVKAWTKLAGCSRATVCFTGPNNFRKRILPTYKSNRVAGKPLVYQETVMAVEERYRCERVHGLEADDLLGIMATTLPKYQDAVVVSIDKDMRTFPGRHFNPLKDKAPDEVMAGSADYNWMMQTLMGDTSDGYKGLPGVGEAKAKKILGTFRVSSGILWPKVVSAFRAKKLTEDDALIQARVARILRREDYERETKSVLLWHPTERVRIALQETE
jgi:5'-3' exonuclease